MVPSDSPEVDVIVAVHTTSRPVERTVASVLASSVDLRVSVVAHNVDPRAVGDRLGALADDPRVRILCLADGVRSPGNAFNHGLSAASGTFVCVVGSDDTLEHDALAAWVETARRTGADAVIAPIIRDDGRAVPTPRIRPGRAGRILDIDRDRLFDRTAALGLQRRETTSGLRYADGLARGVDQDYGIRLWGSGRIVFDPASPAYREHADQRDRVTHEFGPLGDDFGFLDRVLELAQTMRPGLRRAVLAKLIRVHIVPAVRNRARVGSLTSADLAAAAALLERLTSVDPRATALLPRDLATDAEMIRARNRPTDHGNRGLRARVRAVLPRDLRLSLHRHAPLRTLLAGRRVAQQGSAAFAAREARAAAARGGSR